MGPCFTSHVHVPAVWRDPAFHLMFMSPKCDGTLHYFSCSCARGATGLCSLLPMFMCTRCDGTLLITSHVHVLAVRRDLAHYFSCSCAGSATGPCSLLMFMCPQCDGTLLITSHVHVPAVRWDLARYGFIRRLRPNLDHRRQTGLYTWPAQRAHLRPQVEQERQLHPQCWCWQGNYVLSVGVDQVTKSSVLVLTR